MQAQDTFIDSIRKALGRPLGQAAADNLFTTAPSETETAALARIRNRSAEEKSELTRQLQQVTGSLHIDFHPETNLPEIAHAIGRLIREKQPEWGTQKSVVRWDHPLIDRLQLESLPELEGVAMYTTSAMEEGETSVSQGKKIAIRNQIEESFIGITSADYCVAATATLAMKSRPGQARSVSLVPSIHVAIVEEKNMLATLEELYTLLKWDKEERAEGLTNCLSLISGPSKTGDIELIMVHGAHGPRELHLFVASTC